MKYRNIYRWLILPVLLFTMVGLLFVGTACPPTPTAVSVSPYDPEVAPEGTFIVDILVEPTAEIAGVQFDLTFDPSLVTAISVTEGDLFNQRDYDTYFREGTTITIDNHKATIVGVACVITTPGGKVSSPGTLATITFTAGTTAGESVLQLSNVIVGWKAGTALPVQVMGGRVTVSAE